MNQNKRSCINCNGRKSFADITLADDLDPRSDYRCTKNDNKSIHNLNPCSKHQFDGQNKIEKRQNKAVKKEPSIV